MAKDSKLTVVSSEPLDKIDDGKDKSAEITEEVPLNDTKVSEPGEGDKKQSGEQSKEPEENVPPKPKRPIDPIEQAKKDLKDAFPNIEDKLITTVLIASSGVLEQAFNGLLYYSDPTIEPEIPKPRSAPVSKFEPTTTDDELLARKLQQEFEEEDRRRHKERKAKRSTGTEQRRSSRTNNQDDYESQDEFEAIKETFTQGFEEAKTTINSWVSGIAKKFDNDGSSKSNYQSPDKQNAGDQGKLFGALGGSSFNNQNTRKNNRFDEDPQIIPSDFHQKINLTNNDDDDDSKDLPSLPNRKSNDRQTTPTVTKKWQPLNSDVPPNSDAFLVDDSEEDEDQKRNKL